MPHQQFPAVRIPQNHNMSEIQVLGVFVDLLKLHISSGKESYVVEHHHEFSEEIVYFDGWFELSGDEYLDGSIVFENIVELIEHGLIVLVCELFASFLLVFDGDGSLPF